MKIYTVTVNTKDYCQLEFVDDYDTSSKLPMMTGKHTIDWHPPPSRFIHADKPVADFVALNKDLIAYDFYGIDKDVSYPNFIGGLAEVAGGVAFVEVEGSQQYSVLFVTEAINALDRKLSDIAADDSGLIVDIHSFAFHSNRVHSNSGLFRLAEPGLDSRYLFAYQNEKSGSGNDVKFYDRYQHRGLSGLNFELIWSSV